MKKQFFSMSKEIKRNLLTLFSVALGSWLIISNLVQVLNITDPVFGVIIGLFLVCIGVLFGLKK